MPQAITVLGVTGASPYDVYVCDITNTYCFFVTGVTTTVPPSFLFIVPPPLENVDSLLLKIIDSNNCEKFILLDCNALIYAILVDQGTFLAVDENTYLTYVD